MADSSTPPPPVPASSIRHLSTAHRYRTSRSTPHRPPLCQYPGGHQPTLSQYRTWRSKRAAGDIIIRYVSTGHRVGG
eukprot:3592840-Rhodomonas_salina.1